MACRLALCRQTHSVALSIESSSSQTLPGCICENGMSCRAVRLAWPERVLAIRGQYILQSLRIRMFASNSVSKEDAFFLNLQSSRIFINLLSSRLTHRLKSLMICFKRILILSI